MEFITCLVENAYKKSKYYDDSVPFRGQYYWITSEYKSPIAKMLLKKVNNQLKKNGMDQVNATDILDDIINSIDTEYKKMIDIVAIKGLLIIKVSSHFIELNINKLNYNKFIKKESISKKICIDYSSPNAAKDLHVGHLRSTIIGDVLARLLELKGHDVHRVNHLGDYGVHIGMIVHKLSTLKKKEDIGKYLNIKELSNIYTMAKKTYLEDSEFKKNAHNKTILIQTHNTSLYDTKEYTETIELYNNIRDISFSAIDKLYKQLNIIGLDKVPESSYGKIIPDLLEYLKKNNLSKEDDGRIIVDGGGKIPLTVLKSDGGYTYDTTDLAALKYRTENYDTILYVVDNGNAQANHFKTLFNFGKKAGWITNKHHVEHIGFGYVLGEDGKILRSRDGGAIKLKELLDESIIKYKKFLKESKTRHDMNKDNDEFINTVAMACVKYADLSFNRLSDYKFSFKKMLSLEGDTAPYILYSLARTNSMYKKALKEDNTIDSKINNILISLDGNEYDKKLTSWLLNLEYAVDDAYKTLKPNNISSYLYILCKIYASWFTNTRCIEYNSDDTVKTINYSRLKINYLTNKSIKFCLMILGIDEIEFM